MSKGFTLIEIIVAISIMTVGIVGIYALVPRITAITIANNNKFIASQLAREGIELVRNIRDNNWLQGNDWDNGLTICVDGCEIDYNDNGMVAYGAEGRYLKINDTNGFYNYNSGTDTKFKRKIIIAPTADVLNITIQIIWNNADSPFEIKGDLYNWRKP